MSTIVVSTQAVSEEPTNEVIQLEIYVKDADFVGLFDQLEVWRSITGSGGPFEELTANGWKPARIPKSAGDEPSSPVTGPSVNVVGKALLLKVDELDEVVITFTGSDPLTYAQVAAQITSQGQNKVRGYVDSEAVLVIETTRPGTGSLLRVMESDAAAILELPMLEPDSLAQGKNSRIALVAGKNVYTFTDLHGADEYFYRTRFRNQFTGGLSEFSSSFSSEVEIGISRTNLVRGYVYLVSLDGKPLREVEVRVYAQFNGVSLEDRVLAGGDLIKRTDDNGLVEFTLVRGQKVSVAIVGTDIVKDVTVPTDTDIDSFNLLDPDHSDQEDYFKVRVANIPYAARRSL